MSVSTGSSAVKQSEEPFQQQLPPLLADARANTSPGVLPVVYPGDTLFLERLPALLNQAGISRNSAMDNAIRNSMGHRKAILIQEERGLELVGLAMGLRMRMRRGGEYIFSIIRVISNTQNQKDLIEKIETKAKTKWPDIVGIMGDTITDQTDYRAAQFDSFNYLSIKNLRGRPLWGDLYAVDKRRRSKLLILSAKKSFIWHNAAKLGLFYMDRLSQ